MSSYDAARATSIGGDTHAPLSDAGNRPPQVHFEASGCVMRAAPPGARILCELERNDRSHVSIRRQDGGHIASIIVLTPRDGDVTEEAVAIASALYWSWWRAMDMRGDPIIDAARALEEPATKG